MLISGSLESVALCPVATGPPGNEKPALFLNQRGGSLSVKAAHDIITGIASRAGLDAPPYRPMQDDRSLGASLRLSRWATRTLFRPDPTMIDESRRRADAWVASLPDVRSASDSELLALVPTFSARITEFFVPLGHATAMGGVGRSALEQMLRLGTNGDPTSLVNRMTAGLGTIESALPA